MQHVKRPEGCISDLLFDELLAGEALCGDARAHLEGCARCSARLRELEAARAQFLSVAPSFAAQGALAGVPSPVALRAPSMRLRWGGAIGGLAMAAAVALVVLGHEAEPQQRESTYETRAKGTPRLGMFIKRDGRIERAQQSARVRGGDLLRFTYTSHAPRYLALLNVEGRIARVYYPSVDGARAMPIAAGQDVALDFSVEQDDSREREGVLAVFCDAPFDVEPLRRALEREGELPQLDACFIDSITLEKAVP